MKEFNAPFRILMGPGPSNVHPRVSRAMTHNLLSHMDPVFLDVMDDVQEGLRTIFETDNSVTLPVSGTGTAGMEAAIVNMVEPGERVVVCTAGYFADRMAQIATRAGGDVRTVGADWGNVVDLSAIAQAVDEHKATVLAFVHIETSTGVVQPIEPMADLFGRDDLITLVDAVPSLGGQSVGVDRNRLDFVYSGSQKCLSCPPGLAPVTVSEKALRKLADRKTPVQSYYFDLSILSQYWSNVSAYHHTAPIALNYALREGLRLIEEEGVANRFERHHRNHLAFVAGIEALGLKMFAQPEIRAWTVNTVAVPDGIDDAAVRAQLLERYGIEIVGGLGPLKGRIWRVGLMGTSSTRNNVMLLLGALEDVLSGMEWEGLEGSGIGAAAASYRNLD